VLVNFPTGTGTGARTGAQPAHDNDESDHE
jgi:hypothetical protein